MQCLKDPPQNSSSGELISGWNAELRRISKISSTDKSGFALTTRATTPETCELAPLPDIVT